MSSIHILYQVFPSNYIDLHLTYAFGTKWYLEQDIFFFKLDIKTSTKKPQTTVSPIMIITISNTYTIVCMIRVVWNIHVYIGTDQKLCSHCCTSFVARSKWQMNEEVIQTFFINQYIGKRVFPISPKIILLNHKVKIQRLFELQH